MYKLSPQEGGRFASEASFARWKASDWNAILGLGRDGRWKAGYLIVVFCARRRIDNYLTMNVVIICAVVKDTHDDKTNAGAFDVR